MTHALVVDDNADSRYLLRVLLEGHGYSVDVARHGAEALVKARQKTPDVVVSDLLMPVMDGYTLLRQWKADDALNGVPFVVYTATYTTEEDEKLALDMGADAFIVKPAEPMAFVKALETVLEEAREGWFAPPRQQVAAPAPLLEAYNATLVKKLEKKAQQLELRAAQHEQALASLRASEAQFHSLVEYSTDMILLCAPDGRIFSANPAACRAMGMTEAQIIQAGRSGLVAPEDDRLQPLIARRNSAGHASGEINLVRGDGTRLPVEISSTLYLDAQGAERISLSMRDVSARMQADTQRRELEAQLRNVQKMDAIGTLASGIAHDFNNVVGAILGNAALLRRELPADSAALAAVEQIVGAGQRARTLVQRILAFGRRQPVNLETLTLQPLIDETLGMLRATLPAIVTLDTRITHKAQHVLADGTQLQQVLLNLCTNAWHALSGSTGRIEVGLDEVQVDGAAAADDGRPLALPPGAYAHLWVSDSGCGMDAATRARIFEPFFTTKAVGHGTGLGLSVVHAIVAAHQGAITVTSRIGQGSRFNVYLPLVDAALQEAADSDRAPLEMADGGGERVMVVDDDAVMLLLADRLLSRAGYRVTCLEDPVQALATVRSSPGDFDVVVTDFNMPVLSGLDLARALSMIRGDLRIVLSSGHIDEATQEAALGRGVHALLNKERLAEDLVLRVQQALAVQPK